MELSTPTAAVEPVAPTPARQWKTGGLYALPSGNIAQLTRPSLIALATMPGKLERSVLRYIAINQQRTLSDDEQIRLFQDNSEAYIAVAASAFVSPRLVVGRDPNNEQNEIGPFDLSDRDYTWIYHSFVEGSDAESSAFFRGQPEAPDRNTRRA